MNYNDSKDNDLLSHDLDCFEFDELLNVDWSSYELSENNNDNVDNKQQDVESIDINQIIQSNSLFTMPPPIPQTNFTSINTENKVYLSPIERKHKRDEFVNVLTSFGEYEDNDILKVMRCGSLDRIIASSVAARGPNVDIAKVFRNHDEDRKSIANKFVRSLKLGDMNGLAKIISEDFSDMSSLTTPDLNTPAVRRSRVMMYFSLIFETFPDGVWKIQSQNLNDNILTILYSFTGTRVFNQSLDSLFNYISEHALKEIEENENVDNQEYCDFLVNHMAEYVHLSPNASYSSIDKVIKDDSHISVNSVSTISVSSIPTFAKQNNKNNNRNITSSPPPSIQQTIGAAVSAVSTVFTSLNNSNNNSNKNNENFDPSRQIANKALQEGLVKYHRRMDLIFNESNLISQVMINNI